MAKATATGEVLSNRALNRALLARQFLLERAEVSALAAVEHLFGIQAQIPLAPYFALWSRVREFKKEDLSELYLDREVVRSRFSAPPSTSSPRGIA